MVQLHQNSKMMSSLKCTQKKKKQLNCLKKVRKFKKERKKPITNEAKNKQANTHTNE